MMDEDERRDVVVEDSIYTQVETEAWNNAYKYQINRTYTCYGPSLGTKFPTVLQWHWYRPSKLQGVVSFLIGMPFFIIATLGLKRCLNCKEQSRTNQQDQHQLETPL